jgi:hypothetical protein
MIFSSSPERRIGVRELVLVTVLGLGAVACSRDSDEPTSQPPEADCGLSSSDIAEVGLGDGVQDEWPTALLEGADGRTIIYNMGLNVDFEPSCVTGMLDDVGVIDAHNAHEAEMIGRVMEPAALEWLEEVTVDSQPVLD